MSYLTNKIDRVEQELPDNVIGLYRPEDHDLINFYQEPSFSSKSILKVLVTKKDYQTIYKVEGIDNLIHKSIGICGWEKYKDRVRKNTWIKVSRNRSIWAPYKYYIYSDSEYDSDYEEL